MDGLQDILILVSFLIEVAVLCYLELKAWKTLYTPLKFLMLPYVIVLLISIAISGHWGFVEFYYPSILLWSVGLLIFAIPSFTLAFFLQKSDMPLNSSISEMGMPRCITYISVVIILLFLWRFKSLMGGAAPIGTHDFGEEFSGRGFWGHLRQLSLPILMMSIYLVDKQKMWLWGIIVAFIVVGFLYNVLGWIIIPCIAGISLRLYTGKTKLKASLLLYVLLGATVVFFGSYILSLVVTGDTELDNELLFFIVRNFIHYLTSGTLGFSVDMERGCPDAGGLEMIIAQVINLGKVIVGDSEVINPLNRLFYHTGFNWTNVRTFFGTIFINTNYLTFFVYVLFLSSSIYLLKLATIRFNNVYVYVAYFFECGLLFMGWFDSYFASLSVIEIPILALVLLLIEKISAPKEEPLEKNICV